jgi:hypothetical protein
MAREPHTQLATRRIHPGGQGWCRRGLGSASPLTLTAPVVVAAMGVIELIRTAYYAHRRRRLLSRAATASSTGDLVPNAIVVTTGDAIVVNLRRSGPRTPIFPDHREADGPHLRVVRAERSR